MNLTIQLTDEQVEKLAFDLIARRMESDKKVRVREVLPGEPTQERIEHLAKALEHALDRLKKLKDYQDGTFYVIPSVGHAIEYAEAALAPFRKEGA